MGLSKSKGNMYPWVTHTHTHLGGVCSHRCKYCYVQAIEGRFMSGRYAGPLRLIEKELAVKYGAGKKIFVEHCNDLFAADVKHEWIHYILSHCWEYPDNEYVFQTKNPARMEKWINRMPPHVLLGCTIESDDQSVIDQVSKAASIADRVGCMQRIGAGGEGTFVTIEPILKCNPVRLAALINDIKPRFVNIGADSKGGGLEEPCADDVRLLLSELERRGVVIKEKRNLGRLLGQSGK